MGEINSPKFSISNLNFQSTQKQNINSAEENTNSDEPKIKDFGDPKAEALGRSMLIKDADNINRDLKTLVENPQIADNSDKMFETAYNAAIDSGIDNPYEEAASFSTGNV